MEQIHNVGSKEKKKKLKAQSNEKKKTWEIEWAKSKQ